MTVPGEISTVAAVDRAAADALFTEIYQQYADRVRVYIWMNLDVWQKQLAEDLTSETFIEVWRLHILTGRWSNVEKPYGFLRLLARSKIGQHFSKKMHQERALDFGDPVNTPLVVTGHAYALERPDVVDLVRDLDAAMERMSAASTAWRDAHKESHHLRSMMGDGYNASRGGLTDETKRQLGGRLDAADAQEEQLLRAFRDTCRTVGQARADLEAVAGPNWRSSTGLPTNPDHSPAWKGNYRNDRSVTHCPAGHLLDLNNTHFEEDGARSCRACRNTRYQARRPEPSQDVRKTVDSETLAQARRMLADPACAHLSVQAIAEAVGTSSITLYKRIPDLAQLRSQHAKVGAAHAEAIENARRMLADPDCTLNLQQIADACGVGFKTLTRNLPEEVAANRQRRSVAGSNAEALERARHMLTDPDNEASPAQIAKACGFSDTTLRKLAAEEIAIFRQHEETRRQRLLQTVRTMLTDPDSRRGIAAIARACGTTDKWIYRNLPAEVAARSARKPVLAGAGR